MKTTVDDEPRKDRDMREWMVMAGLADGFNADPDIHIPLPDSLQTAQTWLRKVGLSSLADEVELKLNRAAEAAVPKTKELI
jgi:hypothetical protein